MPRKGTLTLSGSSALPQQYRAAARRAMERLALILEKTAPVNTSRPGQFGRATGKLLKDSFRVVETPTSMEIVSTHPALEPVTEGTVPHVITPVNAQALAFTIDGYMLRSRGGKRTRKPGENTAMRKDRILSNRVFAQSVRHPGSKANPFVQRAVSKFPQLLRQELRKQGLA